MKPIETCTGAELLALAEQGEVKVELLPEDALGRLSDVLTELYQSGQPYNRELLFSVAERIREISCEKGLADSPNGGVLIAREAEALDQMLAKWERNQKIFRVFGWIAMPLVLAAVVIIVFTVYRAEYGPIGTGQPSLPETNETVDWHGDGDTLEYPDFSSLLAEHPLDILYPRISLPEQGSAVLYSERLGQITLRLARATLTVQTGTKTTANELASEKERTAVPVGGYVWYRKDGIGLYTYDMVHDGVRYTVTATKQDTFEELASVLQ